MPPKFSIEDLKKMRDGITAGEWRRFDYAKVGVSDGSGAFDVISKAHHDGDTTLIAASPAILSQLIEMMEENKELWYLMQHCDGTCEDMLNALVRRCSSCRKPLLDLAVQESTFKETCVECAAKKLGVELTDPKD